MISEIALAGVKEVSKEIGKKGIEDSIKPKVDIRKRIEVPNEIPKDQMNKIDITKRVEPDVKNEVHTSEMGQLVKEYTQDLKNHSEFPETIDKNVLDISKMKIRTPDQVALKREEFDSMKSKLRKEWEKANGKEWPRYTENVVNSEGKVIRKKGDCYDVHHIMPLQIGGENVVLNITPLDMANHKMIHAKDSSCSRLVDKVGGKS